jgi:hypothetical protein
MRQPSIGQSLHPERGCQVQGIIEWSDILINAPYALLPNGKVVLTAF